MYPTLVAAQLRSTLLDYLQTTFSFSDAEFEQHFLDFISGPQGMMKGPYLEVRLPFEQDSNSSHRLEIKPPFEPFRHQVRAFENLHSRNGHQPQPTLVVTGTGSGKTECFLYPILDHCFRTKDEPGIKAILLYPMNALATDQARRLAKLLWNDERLKGNVTAGLYVGGKGAHGVASEDNLVDDRSILRASPPNILLTNYKMLDYLLQRPEDRALWQKNTAKTLSYLVLDELHTYDGAQGSDVACLIRRLRSRLKIPQGALCCAGTSATIGAESTREADQSLVEFAREVFGEPNFSSGSVISETRQRIDHVVDRTPAQYNEPQIAQLDAMRPESHDSVEQYIEHQARMWLSGANDGNWQVTPTEVAARLKRSLHLGYLLDILGGKLQSTEAVCERMAGRSDLYRDLSPAQREVALGSFVALISYSKIEVAAGRERPFLTCHLHFWFREIRRLLQEVAPDTRFFWSEEAPKETDIHGLPLAYCRDCGANGVGTVQKEGTSHFVGDLKEIGEAFLNSKKTARFVILNKSRTDGEFPTVLNTRSMEHHPANEPDEGEIEIAVTTASRKTGGSHLTRDFLGECPQCGAEGSISLLGSRAATLSSVAISLMFNSPFNEDKKLLAFTDSVQDASHRSGFFAARTYRFHLRTQLQRILNEAGGTLPLDDCCPRMLADAEARGGRSLAEYWPSDLQQNESYLRYQSDGELGDLLAELKERLSWEVCMEYGYSARVGRTLEKTGCSTVQFEAAALSKTAAALSEDIHEQKLVLAQRHDPATLQHFLSAVLHRLRVRGGVVHPLLMKFIVSNGDSYMLSKKQQPLLSPFPPGTRQPKFLSADSSHDIFDVFRGTHQSWYQDWARRSLGLKANESGIPDLYRVAVKRMVEAGLLKIMPAGKGECYGIPTSALTVSSRLDGVKCNTCQQHTVLSAAEAEHWVGRHCPRYKCEGRLESSPPTPSYYSRIYSSGHTTRVNAHEHTGLLQRNDREAVEEGFKRGGPTDPNLLVCTPTLELGVDVGDLSATMVCSVPPGPANFVQRMGRAGRTTGNAFCLTVARSMAHDLYFYTQPEQMMRGEVRPPACFLNAPEMLKRQLVAFALDSWARDEERPVSIPKNAGAVLGAGASKFPDYPIEYYQKHKAELTGTFLEFFSEQLDSQNKKAMEEFGLSDQVPKLIKGAFIGLGTRRDELSTHLNRVTREIQKLETNPEASDNFEQEMRELEDSQRMLRRIRAELVAKYPLNVLTDEGVLPNYAFPEPGVTLRSVVRVKKTGTREEQYKTREYLRAASSAIKEFAPFNTFYADGRQVRIKGIDIGSKADSLLEKWRFCPECCYMQRMEKVSSTGACPRCGSQGFADTGQERQLVPFRRASSYSNPLDTIAVDETDDRELRPYHTMNLIDFEESSKLGAKVIENECFGYELLRQVTLREVNFGQKEQALGEFEVAGKQVNEDGFVVCVDCGACEGPDPRTKQPKMEHALYCKHRRGKFKPNNVPVMLYREVKSEAIRILLPSVAHQLEEARASFQATLQLGLRRYFGGDPGHLIIREVSEPSGLGDGQRRHYLVLYDAVPGGTGYLKDLAQDDHLIDVLDKAVRAMLHCKCNTEPNADGCYRCLYGYQQSRDLPFISRKKALELVQPILKNRDQLVSKDTLQKLDQSSLLESELESKFVEALKRHFRDPKNRGAAWEESSYQGSCYILTTGDQKWRLELQKELGPADNVALVTRPDFLLTNVSGSPHAPRIAVYCDGFVYHACPADAQSRLTDDMQKRRAVIQSGEFITWSLSWHDVARFEKGEQKGTSLLSEAPGKVLAKYDFEVPQALTDWNPVYQLLEFLKKPDIAAWQYYSSALLAAHSIGQPGFYTATQLHGAETELTAKAVMPQPIVAQQKSPDEVVGLWRRREHLLLLGLIPWSVGGRGDFSSMRLYLCLDDSREARGEQHYSFAWENMLHTWNLVQFVENVQVLCLTPDSVPLETAPATEESEALAVLKQPPYSYADPSCLEILQALVERGLPLPGVGLEILDREGRVGGEAELTWEELKLAVVLEERDKADLAQTGWTLFLPEDLDDILEALKA